ncbi:MAG: hemolysin family protein [Verrucomicrobiota bacterium]|nr:hemolysin family protein [Verrucomicrobiota bacterium]
MDAFIIFSFKVFFILFLVLLNGFFVAAEFALVKVRSTQLDDLTKKGNKTAAFARHLVHHLDAYLSATQLGITMTSLALGWVGEPLIAAQLAPIFEYFGLHGDESIQFLTLTIHEGHLIHGLSFAIAFTIITFLHIVFGELAPKSLALQKSQEVTLFVAYPLHLFYIVFKPFIIFLNGTANFFLRKVGIEPAAEGGLAHSAEELRIILNASSKTEEVSSLGKDLATRALEFKERVVRDIMIPRSKVTFLNLEKSIEDNLVAAKQAQHSRLPLVRGTFDQIEGLILFKELIILWDDFAEKANIELIKREIDFVPEMMSLERLLSRFQSRKTHLFVVVDEFGATVGIVTLEDVLEELVGDIQDEFDQEEPQIKQTSEDEFEIEGMAPIHDFEELTGAKLETEVVSTLGGYITMELGHLPRVGEQVKVGPYLCTVKKTDGKRVLSAHFLKMPKSEPTQKEESLTIHG